MRWADSYTLERGLSMSHSPPTPWEASNPSNARPARCSARAAASPDGPAPITAYRCSCIVLPLLAQEERAQGPGDLRADVGIRDRRLAVSCLRAVRAEAGVVSAFDHDEDRIGGQQMRRLIDLLGRGESVLAGRDAERGQSRLRQVVRAVAAEQHEAVGALGKLARAHAAQGVPSDEPVVDLRGEIGEVRQGTEVE